MKMDNSENKEPVESYHNIIIKCMTEFQHIEEMIKMILIKIERITYNRLKDYVHYEPEIKEESINHSAMERLIKMLNAYIDDKSLIARLKEIMKGRNHVAHQSLLLTAKDLKDEHTIYLGIVELERLHLDSQCLFEELHKIWTNCNESAIKIIAEKAYDEKEETT